MFTSSEVLWLFCVKGPVSLITKSCTYLQHKLGCPLFFALQWAFRKQTSTTGHCNFLPIYIRSETQMSRFCSGCWQSTKGLSCEHTESTAQAKTAVEAAVLVCPDLGRSKAFARRTTRSRPAVFMPSADKVTWNAARGGDGEAAPCQAALLRAAQTMKPSKSCSNKFHKWHSWASQPPSAWQAPATRSLLQALSSTRPSRSIHFKNWALKRPRAFSSPSPNSGSSLEEDLLKMTSKF